MERGECGACARACNPLPGGFGHQRSGTTAGVGVETLDWDRRARGNARGDAYDLRPGWRSIRSCVPATSQEAWPGAEPEGRDRLARAAVERREASAPVFGAPRARNGVPAARARRGAPRGRVATFVRVARYNTCVSRRSASPRFGSVRRNRKPAHRSEAEAKIEQNSGAYAPREQIFLSAPAKRGRGTTRSVVEGAWASTRRKRRRYALNVEHYLFARVWKSEQLHLGHYSATATKRRVRGPLHPASRGPPPPHCVRGRKAARRGASGAPPHPTLSRPGRGSAGPNRLDR